MAIRKIRTMGDRILNKVCRPVEEMTPKIQELIDDMLETMYDAYGVGLAAPQVGMLKRIVVIDIGDENGPYVLINPVIIETAGEQRGYEGCLSVPGKTGVVTRPDYAKVKAYDEDKKLLAHDKGELQLVASGISGIPVFQVSRYISRELEMSKRPYIEVDFLPEFSAEELYEELLTRKRCHPKLETSYILEGIINNKLTDAVLLKCGIGSRTLLNELTGRQCQNICAAVKCFRADVSETAGFDNAQVTSGGVSKSEIDFEDMSSKVCDGLYLAGEIVDVDGICGGYNLHWAWSSGYIAGKSAAGGKQK